MVAASGAAWEPRAISSVQASADLQLVRRCVDVADLLAAASAEVADLALISPSMPGFDLAVVEQVRAAGVRLVAVREKDSSSADRLGLSDFVADDQFEQLANFGHIPAAPPTAKVPIVAVWGPTGAPGRSTVALSLAAAAAAAGTRTVLVDADVEGGAQAQALGLLDDVSGLISAIRSANQGRTEDVTEAARQVESNLWLLTGLPRADMAVQIRTAAYDAVLTALRSAADVVVVDCGFSVDTERGGRGATTVHTLQRADEVVVVGRADPLGVARLVRALHDLQQIVPSAPVRVVVNHLRRSLGWSARELDQTIARLSGVNPDLHLPWDQSAFDSAAVLGQPIMTVAPTSDFSTEIRSFSDALIGSAKVAQ